MSNNIKIISNENNWLDQSAVNQLKKISGFEGMRRIIGLPDLHPGKTPVGAVFITEDVIYPQIVGSDIGCGMSLFLTDLEKRKMKMDKWVKKLETIKSLKELEIHEYLVDKTIHFPFQEHLGTIGGGNHFAELQQVETIFDSEVFNNSGFDKDYLMLLVHSGSRIFGQEINDEFSQKYDSHFGYGRKTEAASLYLSKHASALSWAKLNREIISSRLLSSLGAGNNSKMLIDSVHNSVEVKKIGSKEFFIHRKGAAPADTGITIIPGSRGTLTYLVLPCPDTISSGYSIAHGAGRKWERSVCKPRLKEIYKKVSFKTTKLKSKVICNKTELFFEEAPEAYKNIDVIIESLVEANLIKVIATFKPVLTYKN